MITPRLEPYKINDPKASYTITFTDNVSTFFGVPNICGIWDHPWIKPSIRDDHGEYVFSDMITVSGDSNLILLEIESSNFNAITVDVD